MSRASRNSNGPLDHERVIVESPGPDEWIVGMHTGGRALHIYRVAGGDWLVSEVGRGTEGRGPDLTRALMALLAGAPAPDWWSSIPAAIGEASDSSR